MELADKRKPGFINQKLADTSLEREQAV